MVSDQIRSPTRVARLQRAVGWQDVEYEQEETLDSKTGRNTVAERDENSSREG